MGFQTVPCIVLAEPVQCIPDTLAGCRDMWLCIFHLHLQHQMQAWCSSWCSRSDMGLENMVQSSKQFQKTRIYRGRTLRVVDMPESRLASCTAQEDSLEIHLLSARGGGQPMSSHRLVAGNIWSPWCSNSPRSSNMNNGYLGDTRSHTAVDFRHCPMFSRLRCHKEEHRSRPFQDSSKLK